MASTKFRPLKMAGDWEVVTRKAICTICKEQFDTVDAMKKHVLTHVKKDYSCTICSKAFATFALLKQHYFEHDDKTVHSCPICQKTFELFSDYQFHLRKHSGEEGHPDSCTVCTTGGEKSCDLELHAAAHSLGDVNGSNTSIQSTSLKQNKVNKENAPTSYVCDECKVVFMKSVEYVKHLLTHKRESYKFFCEFCNKGFTQSAEFEKHLETHEEVNAYVCEYCNEIFKRYSKFEEHLLTHKEKKPHICEICKIAFVQTDEFEKHMLMHKEGQTIERNSVEKVVTQVEEKEQKPYVCQACKIAFTQYSEFEAHLLTHEEIKTYDCKICNKIFKQSQEFEEHLLLHKKNPSSIEPSLPTHSSEFEKFLLTKKPSAGPPYSCESCKKVFARSKELKKHKSKCGARKKSKTERKCSECHEKFISDDELEKHMLTHGKKKFVCSICKAHFPLKFLLNKHHLQMHNTDKGIHICKYCSKTFKNSADLVQHAATHSEERNRRELLLSSEVTFEDPLVNESSTGSCSLMYLPEKPGNSSVTVKKVQILPSVKDEILAKRKPRYKCKVCDKTFTRTSGLKTHLVTHLGRKLYYECKNCAKIFLHKANRDVHQRTHTKIEHVCTICDISFLYSTQYTKHLLTHMREETHKCEICGKSFPQAAELGDHISSHTCQNCGDIFEDPVDLKLHFLAHTEDRPYSCQICSGDFVWNSCMDKNTQLETSNSILGETSAQTGNVMVCLQSSGEDKKVAKRYLCDICGGKFTSLFSLTNHIFHHSGERPFECQFCNRRFSVRSNLKSHICLNVS